MTRVYAGTLRHAALAHGTRARLLPAGGDARGRRAGLEGVQHHGARLHVRLRDPAVCAAAPAGQPAAEPGQPRERELLGLDEHDGELRHEHELAVLRRRVHDVVPEPDGRARSAELRLGRARHGRAGRSDPRFAGRSASTSGTSGSTSTGRSSTSCCRSPSSWRWCSSRRASCRRSTAGDRDDARRSTQEIARGPAASQIAIKQLGTNGGGFYNSNSAVPFENPNRSRTSSR